MTIPVLETARLILREHRKSDLSGYAALWADPVVVRYTTGVPQTEEEAWRRMMMARGHWELNGYGYWVLEQKASGLLVGEAGFAEFHRDMNPSLNGMPEIGWILGSFVHGQGYATEAVRAIHAWGDARFGHVRTCCIISPENDASIRVAEKTGYQEVAQTLYRDHPVIVFHRDP
jgi:RimJ/RimL family protein N-acetyltransferase